MTYMLCVASKSNLLQIRDWIAKMMMIWSVRRWNESACPSLDDNEHPFIRSIHVWLWIFTWWKHRVVSCIQILKKYGKREREREKNRWKTTKYKKIQWQVSKSTSATLMMITHAMMVFFRFVRFICCWMDWIRAFFFIGPRTAHAWDISF